MGTSANLPYTRFTESGRTNVGRVTAIDRDNNARTAEDRETAAYLAAHHDRMTRRRTMSAAEVAREVDEWTRTGSRPLVVAEGWRGWERVRGDTVTGAPRVMRLAVTDRVPATVINWSATAPVTRGDEAHWTSLLEPMPEGADATEAAPVPFMGWTA